MALDTKREAMKHDPLTIECTFFLIVVANDPSLSVQPFTTVMQAQAAIEDLPPEFRPFAWIAARYEDGSSELLMQDGQWVISDDR